MWIQREISSILEAPSGVFMQILVGPRQSGKSSLFFHLGQNKFTEVSLDDLQSRKMAQDDPVFFLEQYKLPIIVDEAQYAPELFPTLKRAIDLKKRNNEKVEILFRLTGSNQFLIDKFVKENLVGRAQYYFLNTLSVSEILKFDPKVSINEILFMGGWPELYTNKMLNPIDYLNNYIRNYIEKDVVLAAGIQKQKEFNNILALLASRSGTFINYSDLAKISGVKSNTVKEWVSILERSQIIQLLPPIIPNLNKRVIRQHKLYFLDTGLVSRLQGWSEKEPLMKSPQAGLLFETLVFSEISKFISNFNRPWKLYVWRTKEKEEIDFVLEIGNKKIIALDAKMASHSVNAQELPASFKKQFENVTGLVLVSYGGEHKKLSQHCIQIPISKLTEYLKSF